MKKSNPLILIHGFPLDSSMWKNQINFLKEKYQFYTLDLLGFGENKEKTPDSIEGFTEQIKTFIDKNFIKEAVFCGFSMGGYITFAFYELFPNNVSALIFVDTRAAADSEEGKKNRNITLDLLEKEGTNYFVENMPQKLMSELSLKNEALLNEVKQIISKQKEESLKNALIAMRDRKDRKYLLKNIKVKTLFLCGEFDSLSPPDEMKSLSEMVEGSKFEIVRKSGHLSPMENPKEFNKIVDKFLLKLK